jgi:hypothetical protein
MTAVPYDVVVIHRDSLGVVGRLCVTAEGLENGFRVVIRCVE